MTHDYLLSCTQIFRQYKTLAEKAMAQVPDEALHWKFNDDSNSIALIVKHLRGNMLSRWTNFLHSDGEKEWRDRDTEFIEQRSTREEMMSAWEEGWNCFFQTLSTLTADDLQRAVLIRSEEHSVMEAINRQIAHYASHVGQIVYISRMCCVGEWISLSVAKGKSKEFNASMIGSTSENRA